MTTTTKPQSIQFKKMGRGPEQTFFQRRYTDSQWIQGKMHIINHHEMQNKTTMKYQLYRMTIIKNKRVSEDVGKRKPSCIVGMKVNCFIHYGTQNGNSSKS